MQRWLLARGVPAAAVRDHGLPHARLDGAGGAGVPRAARGGVHAALPPRAVDVPGAALRARRGGGGRPTGGLPEGPARRGARGLAARAVAVSDVFITRRRPRFLGEQIPLE